MGDYTLESFLTIYMDKLIAKLAELRQSKNARMIFLGVLLLILIILY